MTVHRVKVTRPPFKRTRRSATGAAQEKRKAWGREFGRMSHEWSVARKAQEANR